jgi:hypothetical protein
VIACGCTARLGTGKSPKHHSDRQRGPPGPVPPYSEDDSGSPGQTGAVPGGLLGTSSLKEGAMLHVRFPW